MRICIVLIIFCWTSIHGQTTVAMTSVAKSDLPSEIKFTGKLKAGKKFTDLRGEHILILSETGESISKNAPSKNYRDAELFAHHFIKTKLGYELTWKVYDFIKKCPLDIEAEFLPSSPKITDLDNDGIVEIWFIYKTACHGDASPSNMKLIMYEDKTKYSMRGRNRVEYRAGQFKGGEVTYDQSLTSAPDSFRQFAKGLWDENSGHVWK